MATSNAKPKTKQQADDNDADNDDDEDEEDDNDQDMTPDQKREAAFRQMINKKRGKGGNNAS